METMSPEAPVSTQPLNSENAVNAKAVPIPGKGEAAEQAHESDAEQLALFPAETPEGWTKGPIVGVEAGNDDQAVLGLDGKPLVRGKEYETYKRIAETAQKMPDADLHERAAVWGGAEANFLDVDGLKDWESTAEREVQRVNALNDVRLESAHGLFAGSTVEKDGKNYTVSKIDYDESGNATNITFTEAVEGKNRPRVRRMSIDEGAKFLGMDTSEAEATHKRIDDALNPGVEAGDQEDKETKAKATLWNKYRLQPGNNYMSKDGKVWEIAGPHKDGEEARVLIFTPNPNSETGWDSEEKLLTAEDTEAFAKHLRIYQELAAEHDGYHWDATSPEAAVSAAEANPAPDSELTPQQEYRKEFPFISAEKPEETVDKEKFIYRLSKRIDERLDALGDKIRDHKLRTAVMFGVVVVGLYAGAKYGFNPLSGLNRVQESGLTDNLPNLPAHENMPEVPAPTQFSGEAHDIASGEGVFKTIREATGITNPDQWKTIMNDVGPDLVEKGAFYRDASIGGFGINEGYNGGHLSQADLEKINLSAITHGFKK